jgi:predicted transcriptional regulator
MRVEVEEGRGFVSLKEEFFGVTIDLSPHIESRLKAKADAEGISIAAYVERLVSEEESHAGRVAAFGEAIRERLESLHSGESVDGEEVMARLVAEFGPPRQPRDPR